MSLQCSFHLSPVPAIQLYQSPCCSLLLMLLMQMVPGPGVLGLIPNNSFSTWFCMFPRMVEALSCTCSLASAFLQYRYGYYGTLQRHCSAVARHTGTMSPPMQAFLLQAATAGVSYVIFTSNLTWRLCRHHLACRHPAAGTSDSKVLRWIL